MFGFGSKTIVGLDVGSSSIKAVELRKGRNGIEVAHLGLEPLAPDIVVDSMIVDSGTVSTAISKLFTENQIKAKAVAPKPVTGNAAGVFALTVKTGKTGKLKIAASHKATPLLGTVRSNVLHLSEVQGAQD